MIDIQIVGCFGMVGGNGFRAKQPRVLEGTENVCSDLCSRFAGAFNGLGVNQGKGNVMMKDTVKHLCLGHGAGPAFKFLLVNIPSSPRAIPCVS